MEKDIVEQLIEKIKHLETELRHELQKKQDEFYYRIDRNKVRFEKEVRKQHRQLRKKVRIVPEGVACTQLPDCPCNLEHHPADPAAGCICFRLSVYLLSGV